MSDLDRQLAALSAEQRAELARLLRERQQGSAAIPRRSSHTEPTPCSWMQRGLWLMDQLQPGAAHNIVTSMRLHGPLDPAVLERALNEVIQRHEVLRTTFRAEDGEPVQSIAPELYVRLTQVDLTTIPVAAREAEMEDRTRRAVRQSFDLSRGPLVRATLLRVRDDEWRFVLALHHSICDAWSLGLMFREIQDLYGAFEEGRPSPLPELPIQYADYAAWQRSAQNRPSLGRDLEYWKGQLAGASPTEVATDFPRPVARGFRGAKLPFQVPATTVEKLSALSRRDGATLYMVLLAAFQTLLHRYTGQDDIVIGSVIADRRRSETHGLIGFFLNTLVARADLSGDPTFRELLRRVRQVALEAYDHQDAPFDHLVHALQPVRDPSRNPLFQIMFTFQDAPAGVMELPGLQSEAELVETGSSQFDLNVILEQGVAGFDGVLQYDTDLFDRGRIERMAGHLGLLLEGIAADPDRRLSELPLLTEAERRLVVEEWNRTERSYPTDETLPSLFEQQAMRTPEGVAVAFEDRQLTYHELDARANRLAHHLRRLGVGPETLVGVCMERSLELIVGVLGILKAGGAYVPLDPGYPAERLAFMLADSKARLLLTTSTLQGRLPTTEGSALPCLELDRFDQVLESYPTTPLPATARPDNLAYVIYTSGSTGRPKGVMIEHRSIVNYLLWCLEAYRVADGQGAPLHSSIAFDLTVTSTFLPLLAGTCITILSDERLIDQLGSSLQNGSDFSFVKLTPAHLQTLQHQLHAGVETPPLTNAARLFIVGGEALLGATLDYWRQQLPGVRVVNEYGPTEAAVGCCVYEVPGESVIAGPVPIGRPIANTQLYVLDSGLQPTPIDVPGELYIGGVQVARGYFGQPGLTTERFVPNPFSPDPQARLYKTGDLARWRADGNLDYLGRLDDQVKLRGFRIEPGEIEATLLGHPSIREAAVITREDRPGDLRLAAYMVGADGAKPGAAELRAFLGQRLPEYMVPSTFTLLDALPLSPNGKLDRRALPEPEAARPELAGGYVAPRSQAEDVLAGIWAGVLGLERVGILDDFFELGGHSLLATRMLSRVRVALGVELPLRAAFEARTVAMLAGRVEAARATTVGRNETPLARIGRDEPLPLSFAQQRLWVLDQLDGGGPRYNIPLAFRLRGRLDPGALERALLALVARHESLRTSFEERDGRAYQVIAPEPALVPVWQDLRVVPADDRAAELARRLAIEALRPFNLSSGPLLRARILQLGDEEHALMLTIHHIVADGWSLGVLWRDLAELYAATAQDRAPDLPVLPVQYADYGVWQRTWLDGTRLDEQVAYWRKRLADAPTRLELPADRPRPAVQGHRGGAVLLRLESRLTRALRRLAAEQEGTLYMVLLAACQVLLARYTGQDDIMIGSVIASRSRPELEGLIGFFANTLVLRGDLGGDPTFRELLARTREAALDADAHQDLPFERLVTELGLERDLSHHPLFQVLFVLQNVPFGSLELPGLEVEELEPDVATSKVDLGLGFQETEDGLRGRIEYDADLFDRDRIERLAEHLTELLEGIAANPDRRLSELPLLPEAERHLVIEEWNQTARSYPSGETLPSLFEQQAALTPEAVAVAFEGQELTYRELDARANQLAHHLRGLQVGPEVLVAICAERSLELVVGLLGILKAGGAYVPLDPGYPAERLAFMLKDAQAPVLLTQRALVPQLPATDARIVCLDSDWPSVAASPATPMVSGVGAGHLAYMIYTSGSTGQPKGAMNAHRGIVNRLLWMRETHPLGPNDRVLQKTPYSFDVSVWEFCWPLLTGARLVVARPEGHRDPSYLRDVIRQQAITMVHFVPSMLQAFLQEQGIEGCTSLRRVICSGEALTAELRDRCFARLPNVELHNLYGPTEAAIEVTAWTCRPDDTERAVPIGRPIANTRVYVLDQHGRPTPIGVPGELHLGGVQVGRGYLNRPELTAERFVPDTFSPDPAARLYKTGDLARWRSDGAVEYLGRLDDQVKVRGFRIEPGEIEALLLEHPAIREAAVVARTDQPGVPRLVAYLVSADGAVPAAAELRGFLGQRLPEYMVPAAFVELDTLPLTPSGKLDRRILPAPELGRPDLTDGYVAPRTPIEATLADIWGRVLGVEGVGIHDSFFDLGGDSILSLQVVARARQAGLELQPTHLFQRDTIAELASVVKVATSPEPAPTAADKPLVTLDPRQMERILARVRVSEDKEP